MKGFALAGAVLVLVGVSIALAERDREDPSLTGIFAELKVGQVVQHEIHVDKPYPLTVLHLPAGLAVAEFGKKIREDRKLIEKEMETLKADLDAARNLPEERSPELELKRLRLSELNQQRGLLPRPSPIYEVTHVSSEYVKLENASSAYCIPVGLVSYIHFRKVD